MTKLMATHGHAQADANAFQVDAPAGARQLDERESASGLGSRRINPGALLALVLLLLSGQNLLLWRFLNIAAVWTYPVAVSTVATIAYFMVRAAPAVGWRGPSVRSLLLIGATSLVIYLLGGEGRLFYANADWQVRDAVLLDLINHPWPFAYDLEGHLQILRAPIGMFLIPALIGKVAGPVAADFALLIQNSLLLTLLLGLGSTLFASRRARVVGLIVVVIFSGMDIIGQALRSFQNGMPIEDHLERWAAGIQFSSHITQAFWVPQHALAGWFGALLFLLWRDKRISLGQMYALLPLLLLLSPLGAMGTLPFAAFAGIATLVARGVRPSDFLLPLATLALGVPAILYLAAAGDTVGMHVLETPFARFVVFEIVEVLPYLLGAAALGALDPGRRGTFALVAACLLVMPFVQIGEGIDFTMRVSITALAILSVEVARVIAAKPAEPDNRVARGMLIAALLIGSVTGGFELARALMYRPTPRVQCSLASLWDQDQIAELRVTTNATYFAAIDALPPLVRPRPVAMVQAKTGAEKCWIRPWRMERFGNV